MGNWGRLGTALLLPVMLLACQQGGRTTDASGPLLNAGSRAECALSLGEYTQTWEGTVGLAVAGTAVSEAEHLTTLSLPPGCTYSAAHFEVSWTVPADLDLQVLLPAGGGGSAETGSTSTESLSIESGISGGDFKIRVYGYTSAQTAFSGRFTATVVADSDPAQDAVEPLPQESAGVGRGIDDVVVVAVIDSGMNPYHWDFLAEKMPQHNNAGSQDDLPLQRDPATWIAGHPGAQAFASYEALNLDVVAAAADPQAVPSELHDQDIAEWSKIQYSEGSSNDAVHMYWIPGTKVIGHVAFGSAFGLVEPTSSNLVDTLIGPSTGPVDTFAAESHGIGSASVSTGNIHGTCPNCVLVYVHGPSERANEWVAAQDWIDVQTNSWGLSVTGGPVRDNVYAGSNTEVQRVAVERGQSWFQSAGNGLANAFTVPSSTLLSSQKGPDWIVTVGAIEPEGSSVGHNRPVDISSLGTDYPSATGGGDAVTAEGDFSGTSNATPVIAGLYSEVLYRLRRLFDGPSRSQSEGVIATGAAACAAANPACAMADGQLTVHELQQALFLGAQYSAGGTTLLYQIGGPDIPDSANSAELEFVSEGHGSYYGRYLGDETYEADVQRIIDIVRGALLVELSEEQRNWLIADSACRQSLWGSWSHGYFDGSNAPAADPAWPIRSFLADVCPQTLPPVVQALQAYADITAPQ